MPHTIRKRKIRFTREEVDAFRRSWPNNELESRSYWFEFDQCGNFIDTDVPEHSDGHAALALSHEAEEYLEVNPDEVPNDPVLKQARITKDA